MTEIWLDNPKVLFNQDEVLDFWPRKEQDPENRINSATRFIIYATVILYLLKRDQRVFILALLVIGAMVYLYKRDKIAPSPVIERQTIYQPPPPPNCQKPTRDNPMANVLLSDYVTEPNRPSACYYPTVANLVAKDLDDTFPTDQYPGARSTASRQFYSNPSTTIPNDQTAFAEFCYGKKNKPMCKDTPGVCNPNARGVQLEAFSGIDSANQPRTGMFGGSV